MSGGTLNAEEEAEATALRNLAASIRNVRMKSNALEAMVPIPSDYTNDVYWT